MPPCLSDWMHLSKVTANRPACCKWPKCKKSGQTRTSARQISSKLVSDHGKARQGKGLADDSDADDSFARNWHNVAFEFSNI
ncbi:hypothetical protein TYRP_010700 [Tyrophagus putrescentiae]|nr:hypothetical protein TYRP_010700 [Tyrophagus putrescentiae]